MSWRRLLTGMERWQWLFDRAAPMNAVMVARVAGRFDRQRLRRAVDAVAAHYPTLAARIDSGSRPAFVACDRELPLDVRRGQPGGWRSAAVEEINTRIPTAEGPLARVVVLDGTESSNLLLTFHQAAADGLSAAHMVDEILTVYGGGPLAAVTAPEMLVPPLEDALGSRLAALATTLREIPAMRRLSPLPPDRWTPPEDRRTALIDARLPASRTLRLAREASARGTSVHGALAAAMLLSIGVELRGQNHARRDRVGCATTIDLRRRLGLSAELAGNLFSRVVSCHTIHYDALFWDIAAEVSRQLRHATATGDYLAYANLKEAKAIGVRDGALAKRVRKSERYNRAAAIIHNLGRLELYPRYGDVTLERLGFVVGANAYVGSSIVLSAVTQGDSTCLNFTFADPMLSPEQARGIVDDTLARLQRVVS